MSDNVASSSENAACTTDNIDNTNDPLSDDVIAEGDEHIRQITGGPQASMMLFENQEAFGQTVSIAPAEGQKPLSIMTDAEFEAMVNPDKFCFGKGTFVNVGRSALLPWVAMALVHGGGVMNIFCLSVYHILCGIKPSNIIVSSEKVTEPGIMCYFMPTLLLGLEYELLCQTFIPH